MADHGLRHHFSRSLRERGHCFTHVGESVRGARVKTGPRVAVDTSRSCRTLRRTGTPISIRAAHGFTRIRWCCQAPERSSGDFACTSQLRTANRSSSNGSPYTLFLGATGRVTASTPQGDIATLSDVSIPPKNNTARRSRDMTRGQTSLNTDRDRGSSPMRDRQRPVLKLASDGLRSLPMVRKKPAGRISLALSINELVSASLGPSSCPPGTRAGSRTTSTTSRASCRTSLIRPRG